MTIQFKCSACQAPLQAPDEMAGRKAKCRQCGGAVVVPNPTADRWPPGMAPPSSVPQAPAKNAAPRPAATKSRSAGAAKTQSPPTPALLSQAKPAAPQIAVPVAKAIPVSPAAPARQAPPPQAVPVAAPLVEVAPVVQPVGQPAESGPLDDIAAILDFEKSAPRAKVANPFDDNPYQSPRTTSNGPERREGPAAHKRVCFRATLRTTWQIFKANLGVCIGATVMLGICSTLAYGIIFGALLALAQLVVYLKIHSVALANTVFIVYFGLNGLAILWLALGYGKFMLQLARGKPADFTLLFSCMNILFSGAGVLLLTALAVGIGTVLLIVPGILAAAMLSLAPIALIDKENGVIAALSDSAKLVGQNLLPVLLLLFTVGLLSNVLSMLTCGLGGLVLVPFQVLLSMVIYLRASGRRTAVD